LNTTKLNKAKAAKKGYLIKKNILNKIKVVKVKMLKKMYISINKGTTILGVNQVSSPRVTAVTNPPSLLDPNNSP